MVMPVNWRSYPREAAMRLRHACIRLSNSIIGFLYEFLTGLHTGDLCEAECWLLKLFHHWRNLDEVMREQYRFLMGWIGIFLRAMLI